jgi:hypothetical protein
VTYLVLFYDCSTEGTMANFFPVVVMLFKSNFRFDIFNFFAQGVTRSWVCRRVVSMVRILLGIDIHSTYFAS